MATINNGILELTGAIKHKRGTSAAWEKTSYVPKAGELAIATDTGEIRSGDGTSKWNALPSVMGTVKKLLGELEGLSTTAKGNLVAAINELHSLAYNRTISNSAWAHRNIIRGENLGSTITQAQSDAIRNGTFTDIYIGDYWRVENWRGNSSISFRIVDIDYFYKLSPNSNQSPTQVHHVVVMPMNGSIIMDAPYNKDQDISGGYYNSNVRNTIKEWENDFAQIFGEDHLYRHTDYVCNAVNANGDSGYILVEDSCAELPSWRMLVNRSTLFRQIPYCTSTPFPRVQDVFSYFRAYPYTVLLHVEWGLWCRESYNTTGAVALKWWMGNYWNPTLSKIVIPYFTLY